MIFKKGNKLRLITFEEYQKKGPQRQNHNNNMKKFFGTIVTIAITRTYDSNYCDIEDSLSSYHKEWFVPAIKLSFKNIQEL